MKAKTVFGLFAAAATGALAGILFAPASGKETRAKMKEAAAEGYEGAKETAGELAHDANVRYRYARIQMNSIKKTLKEHGEELKEEVRETLMEQLDKLESYLADTDPEAGVDEQPQDAEPEA